MTEGTSSLKPMERLRVAAAIGGSVVVEGDTLRALIVKMNRSEVDLAHARAIRAETEALRLQDRRSLVVLGLYAALTLANAISVAVVFTS